MEKEVMFYHTGTGDVVHCEVCPHTCRIAPGKRGLCRVRENRAGRLYATNYGRCSAAGLDPIEKKPLYHFYPGCLIFSLGTTGCNLRCSFCQNWRIAQADPPTNYLSPERAVELARQQNSIGLAYTYSEPLMWYEYVYDTAQLAQKAGLKNVLVTNGFINEKPLLELLPFIDAMNIDVKAFTDEFYRTQCKARLDPVLRTVERALGHCHIEITTLLVTGLNDSPAEIERLVDWLADLDPAIPLHFSRYAPHYQLDLPPTPMETLVAARDIARRKLPYVYLGNVPQLKGVANTLCPGCGTLLINRDGYRARLDQLEQGICKKCGEKIPVVM